MKTLVIIPCYNEETNIVSVVDNLKSAYPQADYLVVNDCSTDSSEQVLQHENMNYISLPVNLGIGGGVQSGYLYAVENDYDITIQMDGDGQHDAQYLADIIAPIADGRYDMCIGSRFITKEGFQSSGLRRMGINFLSKLIFLLTGVTVKDVTSGFRACNKKMTKFFSCDYAQDYPEPEAIVSSIMNGFKVGEVPVIMKERASGESSINALKSFYYMVKVSLALIIYRVVNTRKKGDT